MLSYWNHFWRIPEEKKEEEQEPKTDVPDPENDSENDSDHESNHESENDSDHDPEPIQNYYFSKEEYLAKFARRMEVKLLIESNKFINITRYTAFEIDGMQVDIHIGKDKERSCYFTYHINFPVIISDDEEEIDQSIYCYKKGGFLKVLNILKEIEYIKKNYKFMEHDLLSPLDMKYAKMQRTIFPISDERNCSVCLEHTNQYTVCHHPICFRCRYTCIKKNKPECPICRTENLNILPSELEFY